MTTTLIRADETFPHAAAEWPDHVTEVVVMLGDWLSAAATAERGDRYDRLIDSLYEWLEEGDGAHRDALLRSTIRRAEAAQDQLLSSVEAAPALF